MEYEVYETFILLLPLLLDERENIVCDIKFSFQGCDDVELLDWLFDQNDGAEKLEWLFDQNNGNFRHEETGHHGNHRPWPIQDPVQDPNVRETAKALCFVSAV